MFILYRSLAGLISFTTFRVWRIIVLMVKISICLVLKVHFVTYPLFKSGYKPFCIDLKTTLQNQHRQKSELNQEINQSI